MINAIGWRGRYMRRLAVIDALVILWAATGAVIVRFGIGPRVDWDGTGTHTVLAAVIAVTWWLMLDGFGSRDLRILGFGTEEYKRVIGASLWLFGFIAIFSYAFQIETARGYVALALPAGMAGLIAGRWLLRQYLHIERGRGGSVSRVLIVGGLHDAVHLAKSLREQPMAGYVPDAMYLPGTPTGPEHEAELSVPVLGRSLELDDLLAAIRTHRPDFVALSGGALPPRTIRQLGWALAEINVQMILAPALTDIAGPRIHTQPMAGLPLIHVSTPHLDGNKRFIKRTSDILGSAALILCLLPVLVAVATAVRLDSAGPVLFRQQRVGLHGQLFEMLKFRSMVPDAETRLAGLASDNAGNNVMFKMKDDPRITRLGRFIRRYSLDELPQLFNVLTGSMSLVGPRPPLPQEVAGYEHHVHRRLLVKPGLTGLWQVSGRSLLSWEDTVRLDLYYVENWSLSGDIVILLRTIRAVFHRTGAY